MFSLINPVFLREGTRARKRERPRTRNVPLCRPLESGMLDYDALDVYRIAAEVRHLYSLICVMLFSHVSPDEYCAGELLLTGISAMLSKLCI